MIENNQNEVMGMEKSKMTIEEQDRDEPFEIRIPEEFDEFDEDDLYRAILGENAEVRPEFWAMGTGGNVISEDKVWEIVRKYRKDRNGAESLPESASMEEWERLGYSFRDENGEVYPEVLSRFNGGALSRRRAESAYDYAKDQREMGFAADGKGVDPDIEIINTGIDTDADLCTCLSGDLVTFEDPEE